MKTSKKIIPNNNETIMSHMCDLIELASCDGSINDLEDEVLSNIAAKYKLSESDFSKIIHNTKEIKVCFPEKYELRLEHLYQAIVVMLCDGNANAKELKFCKKLAGDLELNSGIIIDIIIDIDAKTKN